MLYLGTGPTHAAFGNGAHSCFIWERRPLKLYLGTAPTHAALWLGAHSCFIWARCPLMLHFGTAPTHASLGRPLMLHMGTAPLMLHVGTTLIHAQLGGRRNLNMAPAHAWSGRGAHSRRPRTLSTWAWPPTSASSGHSVTAHTHFRHGAHFCFILAWRPLMPHLGAAPTHTPVSWARRSPPASPRPKRARSYPLGHGTHSGCIIITAVVVAVTKKNSTFPNSDLHVFIPTNIPLCTSGST